MTAWIRGGWSFVGARASETDGPKGVTRRRNGIPGWRHEVLHSFANGRAMKWQLFECEQGAR